MSLQAAIEQLQSNIGTETRVGDWLTVTQEMVNQFADVTLDDQWIHVDVERAQQESPFGAPVAHGFLTLSLIVHLTGGTDTSGDRYPDGVKMGVNYGLNRVRFPHPVAVGTRIRARTTPLNVEAVKNNALQMINQVTVEIEGIEKPGCVAETVSRLYF